VCMDNMSDHPFLALAPSTPSTDVDGKDGMETGLSTGRLLVAELATRYVEARKEAYEAARQAQYGRGSFSAIDPAALAALAKGGSTNKGGGGRSGTGGARGGRGSGGRGRRTSRGGKLVRQRIVIIFSVANYLH
jgi:hypothetical protein